MSSMMMKEFGLKYLVIGIFSLQYGLVYLVLEIVHFDEEGVSLAYLSTDKGILVGIFGNFGWCIW